MRLFIVLPFFFAATLLATDRVPVLVELFTSEGCSSCPPADSFLARLESAQPLANVDIVVLSEHVDYWDSAGWKDPFSSKIFTGRQQSYAGIGQSGDIYTPEAVVDGHFSAVGSNQQNVLKALTASGAKAKEPLNLSVRRAGNALWIQAPQRVKGDFWIAIAQDKAVSRVAHGENGGRTLSHVGVVRSLIKVKGNQARTEELLIELDPTWPSDLRVVAFVQDASSGRVLQVTQQTLNSSRSSL